MANSDRIGQRWRSSLEKRFARIRLYRPHSGQIPLHQSDARFRVVCCGRRWGKTYACINEIVKFAWENPKRITWWVAPSYQQTDIAMRIMFNHFRGAIRNINRSKNYFEWHSGSYTFFKSTTNFDSLRGEGVSFMVIDEARDVPEEAWTAALRPTLSDTMGKAIIISTPRGYNWFYNEWARGNDPDYPEYESFRFPTSSNPYIHPDEIEHARKTLPRDIFMQEYEAEFLDDTAGVFRGVRDCIKGEYKPKGEEPIPKRKYVVGLDLAKHQDYTVITVMDQKTRHVVYIDRFNQVEWDRVLDRLEYVVKRYNRARVWPDATGLGDPLIHEMRKKGIKVEPFKFTATSKQQLVHLLATKIEQGEISFPNYGPLIHELNIFEYEIMSSGHIRYSAPEGQHDDCVVSLALATWGVFNQKPIQIFV